MKAALEGRLLILEGIEKAERNVLPVLNNLLENREMQLEDGRFLMAPERYDKLVKVHTTTLSLDLPLCVYLLAGLGTHTSLLKVVSVVSYVGGVSGVQLYSPRSNLGICALCSCSVPCVLCVFV